MSKIFKIFHIDEKNIKKIYVFDGSNELEVFSKSNMRKYNEKGIEIVHVDEYIYKDDSVRRIKEKIFLHCGLNVSIGEIYLMCNINKINNADIVYNKLTQNNKLELTYENLCIFLSNIYEGEHPIIKPHCELVRKDIYTYNDLLTLDLINWETYMKKLISIGEKVVVEGNYEFTTNPYHSEVDELLNSEIENFISIQNKKLLFEYGDINENIIYVCTCEDVLIHGEKTGVDKSYLLKLYFPELYLINKVSNMEELNEKRQILIQENNNFIKKNNIIQYNESINLLYDIERNQTQDLEYINQGVSKILLTIHPISKINLPLEVLFKIINSSEEIQLVKYNPGTRHENVYRLFTGNNISKNGKKIPTLYVNNGYKKGKIVRLLSQIEKKRRVTYIIIKEVNGEEITIYCNFLENGDIKISIDFKDKLKNLEFIELLIQESINESILSKINNFLEQSGYKYLEFNKINDDNIEILDLNYSINIKNNKKINLNKISKCISSVFSFQSEKIKKDNDIIFLKYKRVSNYNVMDSIDSFITIQRKMGKNMHNIIENLMKNFNISREDAEINLTQWSQKIEHEIGQYENKRVKIVSTPGFNITLKNTKLLLEQQFIPISNIEISNISNVKYIEHLQIYIDSLMRLLIDKSSTETSSSKINKLCKRGQIKEIKDVKEIKAKNETRLQDIIGNEDRVLLDDKIDSIIGMEEDEFSDSDMDEEILEDIEQSKKQSVVEEAKREIEVDDEEEDNIMEHDLSKFSISGNNNIFLRRLREHDKKLFLIEQKKGFKAYSKACPWQYKRYPVVLTDKDKKYIDSRDEKFGVKSYDEHITYGSTEKKNHYICPRFWCFRDDKGKQRSLSFQQVNNGECGGWDAVIPHNAKKIKKGKRIFEFTDIRMHKDGADTDNKLVYRQFYPGYQPRNKHPEGLCVPCCFKAPVHTKDSEGNFWEKEGKNFFQYNYDKTGKKVKTGVESKTVPKVYLDYMYKPGATYEEKDGKVILSSIKGKKWERPMGKRSQGKNFKECNQGIDKLGNVEIEEKVQRGILPSLDIFPLRKNNLGYLSLAVQKFIGFDSKSICQKSVTDTRLKTNTWCLLRIGIEKNMNQSFLGIIAYIYNYVNETSEDIKSIKKIIIDKISFNTFITLQNGNLIELFYNEDNEVSKQSRAENSYINFKKFIKSNSKKESITHEYLWDFLSLPESQGGLLESGLNLIILNSPDNDITHKIQLLCPTNIYSSETFNIRKPSVIIYSSNGYYEPIIRYKVKTDDTKLLFNLRTLEEEAPELLSVMRLIKEKMMSECKALKSMPREYNEKHEFLNNKTSYELKKIIESKGLDLEIVNQVINKNMKVVGLLVKKGEEEVYIPCYPSSINILLPTITFEDLKEILKPYDKTVELLKEIYQISENEIYSEPKYKVVNDNMIVGIISLTNQFIPVNPIPYESPPPGLKEEPDGLKLFDGNTKYYSTYLDNENIESKETDVEREIVVKKIKLESNFFNIFRNTIRIALNNNKLIREFIKKTLEDNRINYNDKLYLLKNKLIELVLDYIEFVDYTEIIDDISDINDVIKCFGLDKKKCNSKKCCAFSNPSGTCRLLLPSINLINGINNEESYYIKISDEMIRYKRIRSFFFDREIFLYFNEVNYNLNEDEIILLENILLNQYFTDIIPIVKSEFIKTNKIYDIVSPQMHFDYSNKYKLEKGSAIFNECLLHPNEPGPNLPEGVLWRKVGLGRWNQYSDFVNYRVRAQRGCMLELIKVLIKDYINEDVTKEDLTNVLQNFYRSNWTRYQKIITNIFKMEGKNNILEQLKNGTKIDVLIAEADYYITLLDIFILALHYNLPIIIFSSTIIKDFRNKSKMFVHDRNSSEFYLLKIGKASTPNKEPIFGIFSYKNRLKVKKSEFKLAQKLLFENGSIKTFDEYISHYKTAQKGYKEFRKRRKQKLKSSRSKK